MSESIQDTNERVYPISVLLAAEKMAKTYIVRFPTTTEDLQSALTNIGMVNGIASAAMYYTGESKLAECLPQTLSAENFDELNYLAARLEEMSESERKIFDAVIEADWHCGALSDIINIDQNLERFDIQPAYSSEQYGEFHLDLARDEYVDIVNRLLNSEDAKDRDFASYIEDVEENLNLAFYGRLQAEREGGVFTEQGYLTENGNFEEIYHSVDDIPAEYCVYAEPEFLVPEQEPVIRAVYSYVGADNERLSETVDFPASEDRIAELLQHAGINGADERVFFVESYESKIYGLSEVLDAVEDGAHPSEINDLAEKLSGLDERGQRLFTSALEMHRYGGDMEGLLNFTSRLVPEEMFTEAIPADVHENLSALEKKPPEKESVLAKIRKAMSQPEQPHKPKSQDKSGPEL